MCIAALHGRFREVTDKQLGQHVGRAWRDRGIPKADVSAVLQPSAIYSMSPTTIWSMTTCDSATDVEHLRLNGTNQV